jgi:hypothetical protein
MATRFCVTPEEIIRTCENCGADDWRYWLYVPAAGPGALPLSPGAAERGGAKAHYARAVYLKDLAIGIAWGATSRDQAYRPWWAPAFTDHLSRYHWVDLLRDRMIVRRYLAVSIDNGRASLPMPRIEPQDRGGRPVLWVPRHKYAVVRLANDIDPECIDFDDYFERCGIEVR